MDKDAQEQLNRLKLEAIPSHLGSNNIYKFEVLWSNHNGGGVNTREHGEYLQAFATKMETEIVRLIEGGLMQSKKGSKDPLFEEILEHAHQAANKCQRFHGREEVWVFTLVTN